MADDAGSLPQHVETTVRVIAELHAQHYRRASRLQQVIEQTTARIGHPRSVILLTICAVIWIASNLAFMWFGATPPDAPPFSWLQMVVSLVALFATILILVTQRREDELAASRAQLTLELAILSEQKTAKIIQMLEELRRDSPNVINRVDHEALAMAVPSDPEGMLNAIREAHDDPSSRDVLAS